MRERSELSLATQRDNPVTLTPDGWMAYDGERGFVVREDSPVAAQERMVILKDVFSNYVKEKEIRFEKMRKEFIEDASHLFPNSSISKLTTHEVSVFRLIVGIENGEPIDPDVLAEKVKMMSEEIITGAASALLKLGVSLDEARARTAHLRPEIVK